VHFFFRKVDDGKKWDEEEEMFHQLKWPPGKWLPDGVAGGVRVVGGDSPDWGAHPGVFRNNHPAERRGKDGRLVHVFHRQLDRRGVAKWARAQEVGVDVPVRGLDS